MRTRSLRLNWMASTIGIVCLTLLVTSCDRVPERAGLEGFEPALPFVVNDTARLDAVIVSPLSDYIFRSSEMGGGLPFFSTGLPKATIAEHAALVDILRRDGVRVITVQEALDSAVRNARAEGQLEGWIRQTFPATADQIVERIDEVDGAGLLTMRADQFYRQNADGLLDPLFPGRSSIYWTRDFAAVMPGGVIIGNSDNGNRVLEKNFARLMFGYANGLRDVPILFDAQEEGLTLDGGDMIVLSENELLLGVGNRSSRAAAPLLARRLNMDIYAVAMPPSDRRSGLQRQLLHLDSIFNIVDTDVAVAVPFFLEKAYSDSNPMATVLEGLAAQMERLRELGSGRDGDPGIRPGDPDALRNTVEVMPEIGWVTRYAAGTGEERELELKLVDFLRERGFRIVFVGGEQGDLPLAQYTVERAMYELRWQGSNVVQLGPGRVIAFEQNEHTNNALRAAGIEVYTFPGQSLSMRNGGPHCLLMPVVRR